MLTIGLVFIAVFLAAFHTPKPDHLPIAVAASDRTAALFDVQLQRSQPEAFQIERYDDAQSALSAVEHRKAYAAYLDNAGHHQLLYAGANGLAIKAMIAPLGHVADTQGERLDTRDVLPLSDGDSRGLSIFYASFGLVLAGFLFGQMTYQLAPRLSFAQRMLSLIIFAVVGGVLTTLISASLFGAIPGSFLALAGVITLMAGAVAAGTVLLIRVFGPLGVPLASIFMLVMGNATSGGVLPPSFLPGWLQPLASVMPAGVGVRAINGLAYFHNDGVGSGIVILMVWIVACVAAIFGLDKIAASSAIVHVAHRGKSARAA
ncbi:ABC transporter permease [Streptomyces sp. NPDC086010]|uniref:ABC transporter permease n=1 Tax=Streptomyces sp. NPDC086010 TaxID=3365745 RepID=UPI0037CF7671